MNAAVSGQNRQKTCLAHLYAYIAILLAFGVIDAMWLGIMGFLLYRPTLGILFFGTLPH